MFYLNKDKPLDSKLLYKMISRFNTTVKPKLQRYKNYYDGKHAILNKRYADDTKPCSKTVIGYPKQIADAYCGYLATPSFISYSSNEDIEELMQILRYNDYQTEDADLLLDALVYGVGAELMYLDGAGNTRFRLIAPTTCFGVYDDSLTGDLLYFVRMYAVNDWDDSNLYAVDVYSDYDIKHYTMQGENGALTFIGEEPHYFNQCPANIMVMPDEKSIYDCVISLVDAVNELVSAEIDDYAAFCDAYMILQGFDADDEDIAAMRRNRAAVIPADANMFYLTKNANDTQVENIIKRLHDSIYRIAQCPDFSSETFVGGVSSGVAIRYRLTGMETRAGKIEAVMKKALQRRVEVISGVATLKYGEALFRDIQIDFKRNIPEDETALVNLINSLKGSVSDATLLAQLPFIDDVNAELEALKKQKQESLSIYGFGAFGADTSEDNEEEV